jgi:hypothetical protein
MEEISNLAEIAVLPAFANTNGKALALTLKFQALYSIIMLWSV